MGNILDKKHLKRSLLTTEDRRRTDYSKYRLKQVGIRDESAEVGYVFKKPDGDDKLLATNNTLARLASAMEEWWSLSDNMKAKDSFDMARKSLSADRRTFATIKKFEAEGPHFWLEYSPSLLPPRICEK